MIDNLRTVGFKDRIHSLSVSDIANYRAYFCCGKSAFGFQFQVMQRVLRLLENTNFIRIKHQYLSRDFTPNRAWLHRLSKQFYLSVLSKCFCCPALLVFFPVNLQSEWFLLFRKFLFDFPSSRLAER